MTLAGFSFVLISLLWQELDGVPSQRQERSAHPDAIGPELQHVKASEVFKVGDVRNLVVQQEEFL